MTIVLDASVLVAAFISRAGVCANVMEDVLAHHELVLSTYILGEVERKLSGKFGFPSTDLRDVRRFLSTQATVVEPVRLPAESCRDANDLPVLGTAVAAGADLLLTGDKDMLVLGEFQGVLIVKPGDFWRATDPGAPT